jgi:hypothetical protein
METRLIVVSTDLCVMEIVLTEPYYPSSYYSFWVSEYLELWFFQHGSYNYWQIIYFIFYAVRLDSLEKTDKAFRIS